MVHNLAVSGKYPIKSTQYNLQLQIHKVLHTTRTAKFVRWLQVHVMISSCPTLVPHPRGLQS